MRRRIKKIHWNLIIKDLLYDIPKKRYFNGCLNKFTGALSKCDFEKGNFFYKGIANLEFGVG